MKHRVLLALLSLLFALSLNAQQPPPKPISELKIRDLWKEGGLTGRQPETIDWSPDGTKVSYLLRNDAGDQGEIWYLDTATGKPAVLVTAQRLAGLAPPNARKDSLEDQERRERYKVGEYQWAPDSKHLLFDSKGQLWYYRLDTNTGTQLTSSADPMKDPKFSSDGHYLAYVKNHQLYSRTIAGANRETQLTSAKATAPSLERNQEDIKKLGDNILNGEVDWLYEEELGVHSNYFWSPDNSKILFLQSNETRVPEYPIEDFLPHHPTVVKEKYPKAGDSNPEVRLGIVGRDGGKVKWINLGMSDDVQRGVYIPRIGWVNDHVIYAEILNRLQNRVDLVFADLKTERQKTVLSESSDPFLEIDDSFRILANGDKFLWSSWRDGHTHLYLYTFDKADPVAAEAKLAAQITKGDFEVIKVDAVDENAGVVYYDSNEKGPQDEDQFAAWRGRSVVARKFDGALLWMRNGGTNEASFAPGANHYVLTHSNFSTPPSLSLCTAERCNQPFYTSRLFTYQTIAPKWLKFTAEDGTPLEGMLLLPAAQAGQKVPVIMNPYGGPHGQVVKDAWPGPNGAFDQILVNDGFAILKVDNRGMGGRGRAFSQVVYKRLGELELKDQLGALDQALKDYPQLDATRIGWWGWSYGGYMTLYAMTHSDRIKAGVSVAPVTDFQNYDSAYTERYMGLPKENAEGYKNSAPVNAAAHLSGKIMEVHGTGDDNVHMQNTIQMIQAYIDADKDYRLLLYPRKTHGISGEAARTHLFERIRAHFHDHLLNAK